MKPTFKYFIAIIISAFLGMSCASVKPYEKVYLNDPEMQMGLSSSENFTKYVHSIREGATPAGSGKASGGCGCN